MKHLSLLRRSLLLLALLTSGGLTARAQSVGIGTATPDASAQLDVNSTTQGLLPPRLTSAQRTAIASPAAGLLVFQTDGTQGIYYYTGVLWLNLANGRMPDANGSTMPANGAVVSTLAGAAFSSGSTDGTNGRFNQPYGVAVDAAGTVYVADMLNHTIRKVTPAGVVSTLAGTAGSTGTADGTGAAARFNSPSGVAVDAAGTVYVADRVNNLMRKITPAGVVSTLAASFAFNQPSGVAVDAGGTVYVADRGNHAIRKITPAGVVSTLAAGFNQPNALAVDVGGTVYVADRGDHTISKITSAGVVSTLAGSAGSFGTADGTGAAARFNTPYSVAVDAGGIVYVADFSNSTIRKITSAGVVSTLAGTAGSTGTADGTGAAARFNKPAGVAVEAGGTVYVSDQSNHTIRVIK